MIKFIGPEQFRATRNEMRILVATMSPSTKEGYTHLIIHVEGPEDYEEPRIQPGNVRTALVDEVLASKAEEYAVVFIHKRHLSQ